MENLNSLAEIKSKDPQIRNQARERQKKLDEEGKLMRKFAMENMVRVRDNSTPSKSKKRKTLEASIEEFEEATREYERKLVKLEEDGVARHQELLDQAKETTRAVSDLCQLWREEREDRREEREDMKLLLRTLINKHS